MDKATVMLRVERLVAKLNEKYPDQNLVIHERVRYVHIISEGSQTMSYGWVDKTNGEIRSGSWKAIGPRWSSIPHVNVMDEDLGLRGLGSWGPKYAEQMKQVYANG